MAKDNSTYDLFISHATEDKTDKAEPLKKYLSDNGINAFYDKDSIEYGDNIPKKLLDALKNSVGIVIISTEIYFKKNWTIAEFAISLFRENAEEFLPLYIIYWNEKDIDNKLLSIKDIKNIRIDDKKGLEDVATEIAKDFKKRVREFPVYKCPDGLINIVPDRTNKLNATEQISIKYFSDFLESKYLKYYSRGEFKQYLTEIELKKFYSENDFIKLITLDSSCGIIIHGQGGIGKTRLMLELGKRLFYKDFIVIKVLTDFGDFNALTDYIGLRPDEKYVLLFDYVEEQKIFDYTINWIINNKRDNIKIIGNCRNSFISNIQNNYYEYFKFIDIGIKSKAGIEKKIEWNYRRAVVSSIINSISDESFIHQLKNDQILKTFYQARPSFAAFIKYIHLKNPEVFLKIITNENFSKWLIKKLKITIVNTLKYPDFYEKKKYVFQLLSCLPANLASTKKLRNIKNGEIFLSDVINKLIKDGWVDETDNFLKVVHDTVNDTLLFEFLNYFSFNEFYIIDSLRFAIEADSISSMLYSVQRIWEDIPDDKKSLLQKNIGSFIDSNLNENIAKEDWFKYKIDTTQLLAENDRINLFIKHKNLLKENFALEKFGSSLAYSIEWVYENITDEVYRKIYTDELKELFLREWNIDGRFDDFVKNIRGGNIISSYINLFGIDDYIRDRFYEYIKSVNFNVIKLEPISLAVVSWLKQNGEVNQDINDLVKLWFDVFEKEKSQIINAGFLISCWLKKGNDITIILKYIECDKFNIMLLNRKLSNCLDNAKVISAELKRVVTDWFKIYEEEKPEILNPSPLIKSWLEKGDDIFLVSKVFKLSLTNSNIPLQERAELIGYWLAKSDDYSLVEPLIVECLLSEIWDKTAYYIIWNWLEKSSNPLLIKPFLFKWLNQDVDPEIFSYIFGHWLRRGDDPDILIKPLQNWLNHPDTDEKSIGIVLTLFIKKKGNISNLKINIVKWLIKNTANKLSVYLLGYLLENIDKKLSDATFILELELPTQEVLHNFISSKCVDHILTFWCEKGGKKSVIEPYIHKWLSNFWHTEAASSIMTSWLINGGDINNIKEFIVPWLRIHVKNKYATSLMAYWIELGNDIYLIKDFIKPFFEIQENREYIKSSYLITTWLDKGNMPLLVKDAIKPWLDINGNNSEESIRVCSFWLEKGDERGLVENYIISSAINYSHLKNCFHVINFWLNKGGDFEIIVPVMINYLNTNIENEYAIRLIKTCIKLNKISKEIEFVIFNIIKKCQDNPFIDYIEIIDNNIVRKDEEEWKVIARKISSNLNRGQSPDIIKKDIIDLMTKYGLDANPCFFLPAWLKYGNDFNLIKDFLIKWLDKNILFYKQSGFILATVLKYEKGFELVHDKAIEWLINFGKTDEAKFILFSWLKLKGDKGSKEIEDWIFYWVKNFYSAGKDWRDEFLMKYSLSYGIKE